MSKPEHLTQDAWDAAYALAEELTIDDLLTSDFLEITEVICNAIMAERAACMQAANAAVYTPVSDGERVASRKDAAYYMASKIMTAIRKRGEP